MKKQLLISLTVAVLMTLAGTVQAGDSRRGNHGHHGGYAKHHSTHHAYRHARKHNKHHRQHNRHGAYGGHYDRGYYEHGYHDRDRDDFRKGVKIVAGAVLLGTIIHAISNSNQRRSQQAAYAGDLWYQQDRDGRCYEVTRDRSGDEFWTRVDSGYCY